MFGSYQDSLRELILTDANTEPDTFILDGQQRLTALYQALMLGTAVSTKDTKGREVHRHYYFDMKVCIKNDTDREEAIRSCGDDHKMEYRDTCWEYTEN